MGALLQKACTSLRAEILTNSWQRVGYLIRRLVSWLFCL